MSQIHMQIDHGGVDIFMSQSVFDVGNGVAATKHIDGPGVAEAVGGVDVLQALWRQHRLKIFFTQAIFAQEIEGFSKAQTFQNVKH